MAYPKKIGTLHNIAFTVGARWIDRVLGFFSTIIIARILLPEDIGIIAMASIVVGLVDVLLALGVNIALIKNNSAAKEDYDTAWTIRLIQYSAISCLIVLVSQDAAEYFRDDRLRPVLWLMAITVLLPGLENIGIIDFQKNQLFHLDFLYNFSKRFVAFTATICAVYFMESYWALPIGTILGRIYAVVLSYRMHSFRPTLSLVNWQGILKISQLILLVSIGQFLNKNVHRIVVGKNNGPQAIGGYTLADEISSMPSTELFAPVMRVLFPMMSRAAKNGKELRQIFLLSQGLQLIISLPASIGLCFVANELVPILLGKNWLFIIPFIQVLAIAAIFDASISIYYYLFIVKDRIVYAALVHWLQLAFFIAMLTQGESSEPTTLAYCRLLSLMFGFFITFMLCRKLDLDLHFNSFVANIWRPFSGATVMTLILFCIRDFTAQGSLVTFIIELTAGAITYIGVVYSLWVFCKKPEGPEKYIVTKLQRTISSRIQNEK